MVLSLQLYMSAKSKLPVDMKVLEKLPVRRKSSGIWMVMKRVPGNGRIPAQLQVKNE